MVRIEGNRTEIAGSTNEVAIDLLLLIRSLNNLKIEKNDEYKSLVDNISILVKTTTPAEEDVREFLSNLHDIF